MARKTASLSAENTFTDWITPTQQAGTLFKGPFGFLDLIISGTWAGTLTAQKRHLTGGTVSADYTYTDPFDVDDFTANTVEYIEDFSSTVQYRVGFKTGNYTSGTALVRLEQ